MTVALLSTRRAFSLLELLLTLAISGILLAAISSSILAHYQTTDAGERLIEEARTVHAWNQRLRHDLSRVARTKAPTGTSLNEASVRERVLDFGYRYSPDAISLWGDRQQLAISRMVTGRNQQGRSATPLVQETIVWSSQPQDKWSIPYMTAPNSSAQGGTGLVRLGQSRATNNQSNGIKLVHGPVRAVVRLDGTPQLAEFSSFPFEQAQCVWRYSNGISWVDNWDSRSQGGLPTAIEVRITGGQLPTEFRFVYHLQSQEQEP